MAIAFFGLPQLVLLYAHLSCRIQGVLVVSDTFFFAACGPRLHTERSMPVHEPLLGPPTVFRCFINPHYVLGGRVPTATRVSSLRDRLLNGQGQTGSAAQEGGEGTPRTAEHPTCKCNSGPATPDAKCLDMQCTRA